VPGSRATSRQRRRPRSWNAAEAVPSQRHTRRSGESKSERSLDVVLLTESRLVIIGKPIRTDGARPLIAATSSQITRADQVASAEPAADRLAADLASMASPHHLRDCLSPPTARRGYREEPGAASYFSGHLLSRHQLPTNSAEEPFRGSARDAHRSAGDDKAVTLPPREEDILHPADSMNPYPGATRGGIHRRGREVSSALFRQRRSGGEGRVGR